METKQNMKSADIYFDPKFSELYDHIEGGKTEHFVFECEYGSVSHTFIKRPIPQLVDGKQYYDLVTAYGYGGPVIMNLAQGAEKEQLLEAFYKAYAEYCARNQIVSEFVRFHPLFGNAEDFKSVFHVEYLRNTIGTDLKNHPDFMAEEYSRRCRKNINQALRKGITAEVIEAPESLKEFETIYYATMDRNNAAEYYYFEDDYFAKCLQYYRNNILLVKAQYEGKTIAAGFYFIWNKTVHIHLSGTLSEYLFLSPAYILRYAVTQWAVEHGMEMIHHGGGRSNDPEDSLYKFKKQFGENTEFPFCVGKKIWNEEIYGKLSGGKKTLDGFFPAYRER